MKFAEINPLSNLFNVSLIVLIDFSIESVISLEKEKKFISFSNLDDKASEK